MKWNALFAASVWEACVNMFLVHVSYLYIHSNFTCSLCANRWRTLLSVDDMMENIVNILQQKDLLDNTYIIFSSDNGYHLGENSRAVQTADVWICQSS